MAAPTDAVVHELATQWWRANADMSLADRVAFVEQCALDQKHASRMQDEGTEQMNARVEQLGSVSFAAALLAGVAATFIAQVVVPVSSEPR